jgi:Kef-type K+ transport system membrane component KefB
VGYWVFDIPILVSLFIGGTLTATSIGVTVRVLADLGHLNTSEGHTILGAAVLDDIMGVVLLALLYEFSIGGGVSLNNATRVIMFVGAFFFLAPIAAKLMSTIIRHFDETSAVPGLIPTMIVSLVLFFAWLANKLGAPMLLGGFAAGLALSRRFFLPFGIALHGNPLFAENIETKMTPIVHLFTPIFFVTVGLSLNLQEVDWGSSFIWVFSLSLLVIAMGGKLLGGLVIRQPWPSRWIIGIAMIPRGEVGLVFAELGRESGIFTNEIYAGIIMVIAFTTLLPPLAMKALYQLFPLLQKQELP